MTRPMYVRGFKLPPTLCDLIRAGVWSEVADWPPQGDALVIPHALLHKAGIPLPQHVVWYVDMLTPESMVAETLPADMLTMTPNEYAPYRGFFNVGSSRREGRPIDDPAVCDMDYAVCIGATYEEDVSLWLDYRPGLSGPRLLMRGWQTQAWCVVARSFDVFARAVGLIA